MFSLHRILPAIITANLLMIAFAICRGLWKTGNPSRYFGEGRFITAWSALQLLAVAALAFAVFRERLAKTRASCSCIGCTPLIWLLISAGFVFLALDETLEIHEQMDKWIVRAFHLPKNELTGRIDDAIIASYGVIGVVSLYCCRRELLNFRPMLMPMVAGFCVMGLSVLCDTAGHSVGALQRMVGEEARARKLQGWCDVGDGAFTVLAEGLFVAAFYQAKTIARQRPEPTA